MRVARWRVGIEPKFPSDENSYQPVKSREGREELGEEAMLHPSTEFLGLAAELHRIRGVRVLHHGALEKIAPEHAVRITKPLAEGERVDV